MFCFNSENRAIVVAALREYGELRVSELNSRDESAEVGAKAIELAEAMEARGGLRRLIEVAALATLALSVAAAFVI